MTAIADAADRSVAAVLHDPRSALNGGRGHAALSDISDDRRTAMQKSVTRAQQWRGVLVETDDDLGSESSGAVPPSPGVLAHEAGTEQRLAGIVVAIKDNIDIAGRSTGAGGPVGRHDASRDAAVVGVLRRAGALILGHTTMHELAWGVTTPGCPNPWRSGMDAGGSSGGSAAAVAAGIASVALGTDTGGSIRIPAALCGVTGLRPTHGTADMTGIVPLAPSLDTVGPLAATAAECVTIHELLTGPGSPAPMSAAGLTVGVLAGWQGRMHAAVQDAIDDSAAALRAAGAHIVPVDIGAASLASALAYVIMLIESARLHLATAERLERRQITGTRISRTVLEQLRQGGRIDRDQQVYPRALALAKAMRRDVCETFSRLELSALLGPVTAAPAVASGAATVAIGTRTWSTADALSRYTALGSVTGLPALSLPAALDNGMPVGVQLLGAPYTERTLAVIAQPIEDGPGAAVALARARL